ncbi:MAG: aspartate carbamoyltransferase regulatory subunit [Candidatus Magasanikbacteria bacterium CG_4_10_14_0_2_um_filter_37_12]|uniref:Aspartate carbamoyltransferase regulatory chain n=1 Tax=Candidatus Magasanikbacteria bacterium CG_4_10_14_0_2_um_filter_37_12 TaxID=1974637 RepID=A0A2M7V861_9BACT|nr:MAG: aspartate carbamoyltransferase regulatory subunit [Candidatus Magasanikbacteria bacterium CG_4_10_14_0_2_um_filter_37_12]
MTSEQKTPEDLRAFKVYAIKAGTVIDHIQVGRAMKIIDILKLASHKSTVTVGLNFPSSNLGRKDIIKVENRELSPEEANRVAIFAPNSTINIIRNFKVADKFKVKIPEIINKIIVCPNPTCITNNETMSSCFHVSHNGDINIIKLRCKYCEKIFIHDDIREYKS